VGALLPDPLPRFSLLKFAGRLFGPSPALREIDNCAARVLTVAGIDQIVPVYPTLHAAFQALLLEAIP
jgi:hypothetical protein